MNKYHVSQVEMRNKSTDIESFHPMMFYCNSLYGSVHSWPEPPARAASSSLSTSQKSLAKSQCNGDFGLFTTNSLRVRYDKVSVYNEPAL